MGMQVSSREVEVQLLRGLTTLAFGVPNIIELVPRERKRKIIERLKNKWGITEESEVKQLLSNRLTAVFEYSERMQQPLEIEVGTSLGVVCERIIEGVGEVNHLRHNLTLTQLRRLPRGVQKLIQEETQPLEEIIEILSALKEG